MKNFIGLWIMCFVFIIMFFFFGGLYLLDIFGHPFRAAAFLAVVIAAILSGCLRQEERIDEMEKRIKELEEKNLETESPEIHEQIQ